MCEFGCGVFVEQDDFALMIHRESLLVEDVQIETLITMEELKTSGYAEASGLKMYYETYGRGELPLVILS